MALARWQATIVDERGNVQAGASVEVRREVPGQPLAVLYSDRDGTQQLGNPITADAEGFVAFHVAGGAYQIKATKGSFTKTWRYVAVGTAAEFDLTELEGLGIVHNVHAGYALVFEDETSAPPSEGAIRFNNADLSQATAAYVSVENAAGSSIKSKLLELFSATRTRKDSIIISDPSSNTQASFQVIGATDNSTYVTLALSSHDGATSFTDGSAVNLQRELVGVDGEKGDKGDKGDPGAAATIAVGNVTTVDPDHPATVTNVGTSTAAVFDFEIPKGEKGDKGDPGDGDVTGPGSATQGNLASFADTSGKLIADSGIAASSVYRAGGTDVAVADGGTGASDAATARTNLGLGTLDSPQFAAVNIGHASDTTLTRLSAGVVAVEGTPLLRASQNLADVANAVTARTNLKIVTLDQTTYDGLTPDPDTLYFITDAGS